MRLTGTGTGTNWRYAGLGLLGIVVILIGTMFIFN